MKSRALASCLGLLLAFLLPFFWGRLPSFAETPDKTAAPLPTAAVAVADMTAATAAPAPAPAAETLLVKTDDGTLELDMQEYLVGVVAAEMPVSFEPQALKAQAVAARSYAKYCIRSGKHSDAQICTDPACCQAWKSDAQLAEIWGAAYSENRRIIAAAVKETAGQYLEYAGEPIFAAFHSSSAAATEDCENVWLGAPYLVSVDSPETAAEVPDYVSCVRCSPLDFRDTVLYAYPDADFTGDETAWIGALERDRSGRVRSAVLGGMEIAGTALRSLFRLRSTAFELVYDGGEFVFTVTGYGHGVGMSQYGANVMASSGADYTEILAHYYTGATLTS